MNRKSGAQAAAEALVAGTLEAQADVEAAAREVTRVTREITDTRPVSGSGEHVAGERAVELNDFPLEWFVMQRDQFPASGPAGLTHEQRSMSIIDFVDSDVLVDCLLWRDDNGALLGILYYYPNDIPPYERAGNVTVLVDPDRRREGIGIRLLVEADRRWLIDFDTQDYTSGGLKLVTAYERHRSTRAAEHGD